MKIDLDNADLSEFPEIFLSTLASRFQKNPKNKTNYNPNKANNFNFETKNLRKAIMKRSKLRNKYLREETNKTKSLYNKQRNIGNLRNKSGRNIRTFWKNVIFLYLKRLFIDDA